MYKNFGISTVVIGLAALNSCDVNNVSIQETEQAPKQELIGDQTGENPISDDAVAKPDDNVIEDKDNVEAPSTPVEEDDNEDGTPSVKVASFKSANPFTDEEALSFIKTTCGGCHAEGIGGSTSFWKFNQDTISIDSLTTDTRAKLVYAAIRKTVENEDIAKLPSPMPPVSNDTVKQDAARFLVWFESKIISVYNDAKAFYGFDGHENQVQQVFTCSNPITTRQFLRRFSNNAFGREPTPEELTEYSNIDTPVTLEMRKEIAAKINSDFALKSEFINYGVRRFAQKLSGANDIFASDNGPITEEIRNDLRMEFFNLVKAKYDTHSFKDMLLDDEVFVSAATAPLYGAPYNGCAVPQGDDWTVCKMKAPRGTFFTTLSYLASKPSTYLVPNNNYGRVATMHFVVDGKVLEAATDGPKGDTVNPLPTCLKTTDLRGELSGDNFAPHGTAIIPLTGNVCQSCHVSKYLAAGSIAFRPFGLVGEEYQTTDIVPTNPLVAELLDPNNPYVLKDLDPNAQQVHKALSVPFLQSLLNFGPNDEQGCIPAAGENGEDIIVNSVKDLAQFMAKDGKRLSQGLARHIPSSISNVGNTTEELVVKMGTAWDEGEGKLGKMFETYFASETFACKQEDMLGE